MLQEQMVDFKDIQAALAPTFAGRVVRMEWEGRTVRLTDAPVKNAKKANPHRAMGAFKGAVFQGEDPSIIDTDGGRAWREAAVERYKRSLEDYDEEDNS